MFVLGHEHLVFWKQPLCGLLIWVSLKVPQRHKMRERPYQPRPRIRILHFLEFKLLDLCCQFPNNQINQQDTGRVLLLSKSVGVLCQANRKPRSTSSKYILIILIGSNPFWHRGLETILHSTYPTSSPGVPFVMRKKNRDPWPIGFQGQFLLAVRKTKA